MEGLEKAMELGSLGKKGGKQKELENSWEKSSKVLIPCWDSGKKQIPPFLGHSRDFRFSWNGMAFAPCWWFMWESIPAPGPRIFGVPELGSWEVAGIQSQMCSRSLWSWDGFQWDRELSLSLPRIPEFQNGFQPGKGPQIIPGSHTGFRPGAGPAAPFGLAP